jgi:hypothetical protein
MNIVNNLSTTEDTEDRRSDPVLAGFDLSVLQVRRGS